MSVETLIKPGVTEIAPGWQAEAIMIDPYANETPDEVDIHEARHGVTAWANGTDIELMTVTPGPGYNGLTRLSRFDSAAAAAPDAYGHRGTSWDRYIIQRMGHSIESAASKAKSLLKGLDKKIHNLASVLHRRRTISGSEAVEAITLDERPEAEIHLTGPEGQKRTFVSKIRNGLGFLITPGIENLKSEKNNTQAKDKGKETDINNELLNKNTHPLKEKIESSNTIDLPYRVQD